MYAYVYTKCRMPHGCPLPRNLSRNGVVKLQLLAIAGAGRLLLHCSQVCSEQGVTKALLMPLVGASHDAGLQHADIQRSLNTFFAAGAPLACTLLLGARCCGRRP